MPNLIGWAIERQKGGLIVGLKDTISFLDFDPFTLTPIAKIESDKVNNRLNDAKIDRFGRLWTGTMHMPFKEKTAALYRMDVDLSVKMMDTPYICTNGPAFALDGSRMYHNETAAGIVYCFDVNASGDVSNKRIFTQFAPDVGLPDGCTVDADDGFWVAHYGGGRISRYLRDGTLDFDVKMPAKQITSLTFGGHDLTRLFVTSAAQTLTGDIGQAGALFEVPTALLRGHVGLPTRQFAG